MLTSWPPTHPVLPPIRTSQIIAFLQAFVSGATARPLVAPMPPLAGDASAASAALSVGERCRIRDRSTILARHMFADQGPAFADQQVGGGRIRIHGHLVHSGHHQWFYRVPIITLPLHHPLPPPPPHHPLPPPSPSGGPSPGLPPDQPYQSPSAASPRPRHILARGVGQGEGPSRRGDEGGRRGEDVGGGVCRRGAAGSVGRGVGSRTEVTGMDRHRSKGGR